MYVVKSTAGPPHYVYCDVNFYEYIMILFLQGEVELPIPRLNADFPIILCEAFRR